MKQIRKIYDRMKMVAKIYQVIAAALLLAALVMGIRVLVLNRRLAASRLQAADTFFQLKEMDLAVHRLQAASPERQDFLRRRTALEATYAEWAQRVEATSNAPADERAIRSAVSRFGEARVLVSDRFVRDVRSKVREWKRTPDYRNVVKMASDSGYPRLIAAVLDSAGLPQELQWVAFQESRFNVRAVGPVTRFGVAKGMWQLMPATALHYGLRTGPLVGQDRYDPADQRQQFAPATRAAVRYMDDLYALDAQGSGLLVMACYNAGQTRVLRLLRTLPATPRERNFWNLVERYRSEIPDETYNYVVSVVAAAALSAEPSSFGYSID